ncbi:ArsC/Spx/MgsR family protein [Paracraurococcus lichenis]|uniref:ArsC/Spx/MgsR family protein n=1 Tax=Paracraurococcus lichenis TaxID=3064888 RepID=A0ABT9DTL5_9PROT|nr:ArsC/Spx/MgsR family protein [Paracraurococcus sp. LOR1-02]MDO9707244.1 ArsC/Spx/MgsR family protein [Paracraurococcus sp. LOR1-02]
MAKVVFFGKPGCAGNAQQEAVLRAAGHAVERRDLLREPWTAERLRGFFGDRPVAAWFNRAAPRIARGELRPETLDAEAAMALLLAEPLLIRRPLLESGGRREVGFEPAVIEAWLGLAPAREEVGEGCPHR